MCIQSTAETAIKLIRTSFSALAITVLISGTASALSLEEAKQNGVRIGFQNEPPTGYLGPNKEILGAYNLLAMEVLKKVGVTKFEPVVAEFSTLIPGLQADRLDIIAEIFITPKRCTQVAFSEPFAMTGSTFLVAKGNPKNIHSYDDAAKGDVTVAVLAGAIENDYAKKAKIPDDRIMALQDAPAELEALRAGRVDAIIGVPSSMNLMAENSGGTAEIAQPFTSQFSAAEGMAFREEDVELRTAFNKALKEFIKTPEFMALMKPVGFSEEKLPGDTTTAEVCSQPQ